MFWKTVLLACLAVGALADFEVNKENTEFIRTYLKQQCAKNGAEDKATEVEDAGKTLVECIKGLINFDTIKKEIEEGKSNGALDEVFGKYCAKAPQLKTCINTFLGSVSPCLEANYQEQIPTVKNGTDQLIDFVCYKDGDRIALFIAEQGPECFTAKTDSIRACFDKIKEAFPSVEAAKKLSMAEKCGKFDEMTQCVVKALETCDTPTPGNMAESLFKYVRKSSACNTALPRKD